VKYGVGQPLFSLKSLGCRSGVAGSEVEDRRDWHGKVNNSDASGHHVDGNS